LFYEKEVRTFPALKREVLHLDSDAGIRVAGSHLNRPCFAFVTRFVGTYTVMVYERKGRKAPWVGRRVLSREFETSKELERFLQAFTQKGVEAYVY